MIDDSFIKNETHFSLVLKNQNQKLNQIKTFQGSYVEGSIFPKVNMSRRQMVKK